MKKGGDVRNNKHGNKDKTPPSKRESKRIEEGNVLSRNVGQAVQPIRKNAELKEFYDRVYRIIQDFNEEGYWTEHDMRIILKYQQHNRMHEIEGYLIDKNNEIDLYLEKMQPIEELEERYNTMRNNAKFKPEGDMKTKMEAMRENLDQTNILRELIAQKKAIFVKKHFNLSQSLQDQLGKLSKYKSKPEKFKFYYFVDNLYEVAKIGFMKNFKSDKPLELSRYPIPEVQPKQQKSKGVRFSEENEIFNIETRTELAKLESLSDEDEVPEPTTPRKPNGKKRI